MWFPVGLMEVFQWEFHHRLFIVNELDGRLRVSIKWVRVTPRITKARISALTAAGGLGQADNTAFNCESRKNASHSASPPREDLLKLRFRKRFTDTDSNPAPDKWHLSSPAIRFGGAARADKGTQTTPRGGRGVG